MEIEQDSVHSDINSEQSEHFLSSSKMSVVNDVKQYDGLFVNRKPLYKTDNTSSTVQHGSSSNLYLYNSNAFLQPSPIKVTSPSLPYHHTHLQTQFIDDSKVSNNKSFNHPSGSSGSSKQQLLNRKNMVNGIEKNKSPSYDLMELFHGQDVEDDLFFTNITTICQIGCHFHLDLRTVIQTSLYWLAEYSNKSIPSHEYIKYILKGIL